MHLPLWMSIMPSSGAYAADEAAAAARALLLHIRCYDRTRLAACPTGRPLTNHAVRGPARAGGERTHRATDRSLLNDLCPRA
jgi:hypothetical protein